MWRTDIAYTHGSICLQRARHISPSHLLTSHVSTVFAVPARSPRHFVPVCTLPNCSRSESAGQAHFCMSAEESGYLADPTHSTSSRLVPSIHGKVVYNNVFCFCEVCLRGSLYLLLVDVLQNHCVILWAVSTTLITEAFIAASCHGVVTFARYFPSRVLMTFSLWSSSPSSQCHSHCDQLRLRVLFLTLLSCIARGSDPRF